MPKDTKTLGNNKARACESLGFAHKKRLRQCFDTTSFPIIVQTFLRRTCYPQLQLSYILQPQDRLMK